MAVDKYVGAAHPYNIATFEKEEILVAYASINGTKPFELRV